MQKEELKDAAEAKAEELVEEEEEKSFHEEDDNPDKTIMCQSYDVVHWLDNVSAWEKFCHVKDGDKHLTFVTPNKKAYLKKFEQYIEKYGEWDREEDIPKLAEKEFHKVDKEFAERYQRIKAIPSYPVLPKVFDVGRDRMHHVNFALLEYVPGSPFTKVSLGPFQIIRLLHDIYSALAHMHRHGILHRRIKSENIYITHEGTKPMVKFVSWGLAVPKEEAQNDRSASKHYVAPEVMLAGKVTEQADLWAATALAYKTFTGKFPHENREPACSLKELQNIIKHEKGVKRLMDFRHFQELTPKEQDVLKGDKFEELFLDILKLNPDERNI